jgi:hypothetical protein
MNKFAAEHIKLAHLSGTATALCQLGFSPSTVYTALMEKGASSPDAVMLTKEAFGLVARGLGFLGSKVLPWAAKGLGGMAAKGGVGAAAKGTQLALPGMGAAAGGAAKAGLGGRLAGWGSGMANRAGSALNTAAQGMKTDPWGTLGRGAMGAGHGMLLGGGHGVGATIGKGMLGATTASAILGSGGPPQQQQQYGMQPQYGG